MPGPEKRVQVKIEVGHQAICRASPTPSGHTHDWSIFVRGAEGADISHFVEKVVFLLHESFPRPRRVCKEPPYKVSETGYGSFNLPVEVYFRNKEEPRKYRLEYDLTLQLVGMPPYNFTKVELLTFLNPSEDFEKKLIKGGAVILEKESKGSPATAVKVEKAVTPPSPLITGSHASPNGTKKTSKVKKDTPVSEKNGATGASSKRAAPQDDVVAKPKKKKVDKGDGAGFREIPILSPATEVDPLKLKTISNKKNIKEGKCERRKSLDFSGESPVLGDAPKGTPKDQGKIKGKEMKVKKEREKDKEKDREKEKEKEISEKEKEKEREREKEKEKEKAKDEKEKVKRDKEEKEKVKKEKEEKDKVKKEKEEKEKVKKEKEEKDKVKREKEEKEKKKEKDKEREKEREKEKEIRKFLKRRRKRSVKGKKKKRKKGRRMKRRKLKRIKRRRKR